VLTKGTLLRYAALLLLLFLVERIAAHADLLQGERYPQTRERLLSVEDVNNMTVDQMRYAINEVYARYGATFPHQPEIQQQFQEFDWYRPSPKLTFQAIDQMMTDTEKRNVKFLAYVRELKRSGLEIEAESTPSPSPTAVPEATPTPVAQNHYPVKCRWHKYGDGSLLLDDDNNGQRLVLPAEYNEAQQATSEHYGQVNPDSYTDHGSAFNGKHSFEITFDIPPSHILSDQEVDAWLNAECSRNGNGWWWYDLLLISYRNLEQRAKICSAEDPERAREELTSKRRTARTPDPSSPLIQELLAQRIQYSGKSYHNDGTRTWFFTVKDPNPASAREFGFPVPVGSSFQAIIAIALESAVTYSSVTINGRRTIEQDWRSWIH
jgi:YARHG domain